MTATTYPFRNHQHSIPHLGVIFPALFAGKFPAYAVLQVVIFATYIIGDLIAIPFSYVFARESDR